MDISKYTVDISFRIDQRELRKVDQTLKVLRRKLQTFGKGLDRSLKLNISGFTVNQAKLNATLGNALDRASPIVPFEVSRFVVNDRNLLAALLRASRRLRPPPGPNPPPGPGPGPDPRPGRGGPGGGGSSRLGLGFGFGPLGYGALALAGGGYGLGALNRRNQAVVSAQLQSQSVVQQAGGTVEQGDASFQFLKDQADRIGFNYLDASGDYNKLLAGLTGAGLSIGQGQDVFKGFAEIARVNKLDRTAQNRLFRALSQVAGKDQLMSEELNVRLAA